MGRGVDIARRRSGGTLVHHRPDATVSTLQTFVHISDHSSEKGSAKNNVKTLKNVKKN